FLCFLRFFFFSSRRRHTRSKRDWSSDVCSSDLSWELCFFCLERSFAELTAPHVRASCPYSVACLSTCFRASSPACLEDPAATASKIFRCSVRDCHIRWGARSCILLYGRRLRLSFCA